MCNGTSPFWLPACAVSKREFTVSNKGSFQTLLSGSSCVFFGRDFCFATYVPKKVETNLVGIENWITDSLSVLHSLLEKLKAKFVAHACGWVDLMVCIFNLILSPPLFCPFFSGCFPTFQNNVFFFFNFPLLPHWKE